MNLVKWFRKYNKKIMAIVVIVIMFGFIGGGTLLQQLTKNRVGAIAYYGKEKKITDYDLLAARRDLEMLRMLRADDLLRSQDLNGVLLAELLFSDQRAAPALINRIKQTIRANRYRISEEQIDDIYRRQYKNQSIPPGIFWLLLQREAQNAGIGVSNAQVGELLGRAIPQLFQGQTYSQLIGAIIRQQGIPEQQILTTFGKLLSIFQYSAIACSDEDMTIRELKQLSDFELERLNVDLVEFASSVFAEEQGEPNEEKIAGQFNKYKATVAGAISDEDPYGFGYKLPNRVQLEYIAVKLDDVKTIVKRPTQDEIGEYYSRNKESLFTEEVPSDPNDPNSPMIKKTKSYAEVAGSIAQQLFKDKINATAQNIIEQAATITEASFGDLEIESEKVTTEQIREKAGDYSAAAAQLSKKYKIKVYSGKTGLLSPLEMQSDEQTAGLYLEGYGQNPVSLIKVVFAVDELGVSELGPFEVPKPRMFENIGPVKDMASRYSGKAAGIMALVRVIEAKKAAPPENIDVTYNISTLQLDPNEKDTGEQTYSVKEKVVEDLKKLAAMDTAKSKAEEFIPLAKKDGWTDAINKFEELYGRSQQQDANEPNAFRVQSYPGMRRISNENLETLAIQGRGDPMTPYIVRDSKINQKLADRLYALVPEDKETIESLPLIVEFKPDLSYYVIKDISIKRLYKEEYEKTKVARLFREEYIEAQSLAAVHFNPANILSRMNFRMASTREPAADVNAPDESEAAS
jgi:hypothetical protein